MSDTSYSCSSNRGKRGRPGGQARGFLANEVGTNGNYRADCACNNPTFASNGTPNVEYHELRYSWGTRARRLMLDCKYISADVRRVLQAEEDLFYTRKRAKKEDKVRKAALQQRLKECGAAQRQVTTYFASAGARRKNAMHEVIARFVYDLNLSARCIDEDAFHAFVESILDTGISLGFSATARPRAADHVHKPSVTHLQSKLLAKVRIVFRGS